MRGVSIFNRGFKQHFNQSKYRNLTSFGKEPQQVGMSHFSLYDVSVARACVLVSVVSYSMMAWQKPEWFHEIFGHYDVSPVCQSTLSSSLGGPVRRLNMQVIKREQGEHQVHAFLAEFTDYQ